MIAEFDSPLPLQNNVVTCLDRSYWRKPFDGGHATMNWWPLPKVWRGLVAGDALSVKGGVKVNEVAEEPDECARAHFESVSDRLFRNAGVAQWQSDTLPTYRPRVRCPLPAPDFGGVGVLASPIGFMSQWTRVRFLPPQPFEK